MKITKLSKLAGVTVRTLHYYDKIGLLTPTRCCENNRREYSGNDILMLQQILYYKESGFSLKQINEMMKSPDYDYIGSFATQISVLEQEKSKIDLKILNLRRLIDALKNDLLDFESEQFDELFGKTPNPYRQEAVRLWGKETVMRSEALVEKLPEEQKKDIEQAMGERMLQISNFVGTDPASAPAQRAIRSFHQFMNQTHGGLYTLDRFAQLGDYYAYSEVFRASLESIKPSFSDFMQQAIHVYVNNRRLKLKR